MGAATGVAPMMLICEAVGVEASAVFAATVVARDALIADGAAEGSTTAFAPQKASAPDAPIPDTATGTPALQLFLTSDIGCRGGFLRTPSRMYGARRRARHPHALPRYFSSAMTALCRPVVSSS